jgi:hypothetical protein
MSLIPSESASFSDLLGRGLGASRKSKWRQSDEPPVIEAEPPPLKKAAPVPDAPTAREDDVNATPAPVSEPPGSAPAEVEEPEKTPAPSAEHPEPVEKPAPVSTEPPEDMTPSPPRQTIPALVMTKPVSTEPPPVSSESERTYAPIPIVRIVRSAADRQAVKSEAPMASPAVPDSAAVSSTPTILGPTTSAPLPMPRLRPRPVLHPRSEPARVREPEEHLERADLASAPLPPALEKVKEKEKEKASALSVIPAESTDFLPTINTDVTEDYDFPEPPSVWPLAQRRRRARLVRFVALEVFVLLILAVAVLVGLNFRLSGGSIAPAARIIAIVAAVVAVVVPILFYGIPETLPRDD